MITLTSSAPSSAKSPYQLRSLTRADNPEGCAGTWYRYVIEQGLREITGRRSGSEAEVSLAVHAMLDRLNQRDAGKATASRKPRKAAPAATLVKGAAVAPVAAAVAQES